MIDSCGVHLQALLWAQLDFERGEQRGQNHPEVSRQSVSCHRRQEGEDTRVYRRSRQLEEKNKALNNTIWNRVQI